MAEVPIRELIPKMQDLGRADVVVFDGIITQRLIELANKIGVRAVYGIKGEPDNAGRSSGMLLFTKDQGMSPSGQAAKWRNGFIYLNH